MGNSALSTRAVLDYPPPGAGWYSAGLTWLLALGWWLVLGRWLRRSLRPALGAAAAGRPSAGPPTRPRRPKNRPRPSLPQQAYPSAA